VARTRIICFGDSITHAGTVQDPLKRWPLVVERRLRGAGRDVEIVASGVPGQTTTGAMARIERDVLSAAPDVVLIEFGFNDAWRRDGENPQTPPEEFAANLRRMVELVRERTPARAVLVRNHATREEIAPYDAGSFVENPASYNIIIERVAREAGAGLLDVHRAFLERHAGRGELFTGDGLHLAEAGSLLYAEVAAEFLEALLAG
jgi:acyl-CoA thioesterase-1